MNKRGFTLVELLAVIIILSLLALLTSTAVTKLVKDAKDDLSSTQIQLIKSAAQTWGADNLTGLPEAGKCSYLTVKNLKDYGLLDSNLKDLNKNENMSDDLKIKISTEINENSGKLITIYEVNPESESLEGCYQQAYNNGEVVYYDIKEGKGCSEIDYKPDNSIGGYNGYVNKNVNGSETEKLNTQNTCLKFYAFNDNGQKKLNLLLDHDIALSDWDSAKKDALECLYNGTKDWDVQYISKNFILDQPEANQTNLEIEYTKVPTYDNAVKPFKARFIETQEIEKITGADKMLEWNQFDAAWELYFDGAKGTDPTWKTQIANENNKSEYYWLYDRTRGCISFGCNISDSYSAGYFTSTYFSYLTSSTYYSWVIYSEGKLAVWRSAAGIRPVVEVLKSNL